MIPTTTVRRAAGLLLVGVLVAAGCSSGESATDAGRDDDETTATTADSAAVTETTDASLDDHPPCPTDALDDQGEPVEVTVWHTMTNENEPVLENLTTQFNESQDRVRVRLQNQDGYNAQIDSYRAAGQGARPDIVQMPEYMLQEMADSDSVIPAGACIESSGFETDPFMDRVMDTYQIEDIQWGMPFNVSNPVLIYRKDSFEEAGLDPDDPPITLEELRDHSEQLVESGTSAYGIALESGTDSGGGWFMEQWLAKAGEPFADNDNGRAGRATQVLYDNDVAVDLFTELQSLVEDELALYVGDNPDGADQLLALADPGTAPVMAIASSATLGTIKTALEGGLVPGTTADDFGVGPMPGPDDYSGALVGGASLYVAADKSDPVTAGAWEYIEFMTSAEAQSEWAAGTGYVPVREDAIEIDPLQSVYEDDPRFMVAYDQLTVPSDDPATNGPVLGPMREIRAANADATAAILSGGDVASELEQAANRSDTLIQDYNDSN